MRRHITSTFLLFAFSLLAGCSSVDTAVYDGSIAPLTIAVLQPEGLSPPDADSLRLAMDERGFQDALILGLRKYRTATRIVPATSLENAMDLGADAFVLPRFSPRSKEDGGADTGFRYSGYALHPVASLLLWAFTGPISLIVRDSTYQPSFDVYCEVGDARRMQAAFTRVNASVGAIKTTWLNRTDLLDPSWLWAFISPPVWCPDQPDAASDHLTERCVDGVAANLARFFVEDFEGQALQHGEGSIEIKLPPGGFYDLDNPHQTFDVVVRRRGGPTVWVNAVFVLLKSPGDWPADALARPKPEDVRTVAPGAVQPKNGVFETTVSLPLTDLLPGRYAVVVSATGDREFSRSLRADLRGSQASKK